jgi:hypothetical protein
MPRRDRRKNVRKTDQSHSSSNPEFEFRWKNFRSFVDSGWVKVSPITIFLGSNNSGKSSLFAPLLLLKQSLESGDPALVLKTTGPLINLGGFRDLVFKHDTKTKVSLDVRFASAVSDSKQENMPAKICVEVGVAPNSSDIVLQSLEISDVLDRHILTRKRRKTGDYTLDFLGTKGSGRTKRAFLESKPEHFFFPSFSLYLNTLRERSRKHRKLRRKRLEVPKYVDAMATAQALFNHFLSHVSFLGPLRKQPKRFYEISGEVPESVGAQGENTAEILYQKKTTKFVGDINGWVSRFGLDGAIKCDVLAPGILAVHLAGKGPGSEANFADMGFGFSQLLPLIVQGLHGHTGDTLIVEQPEIHLNPRLQCTLADFFVSLIASRKSVIVETHSEHLIMRLRSLIAQGKVKPELVNLYFVEKVGDHSTVRRIGIHADGHIEPNEWPKGFFEEGLAEALSLARPTIKGDN